MVSAVAWALMDYASQNADRGSVDGFDAETAAAAFTGWCEDQIEAIIEAIFRRNDNTRWTAGGGDKRQPKREDSSTERVAKRSP